MDAGAGEVSPAEARALLRRGAVMLDLRDAVELFTGTAEGATHVPRCEIEQRVPQLVPDPGATLLLLCASGVRSLSAARQLAKLGYRDVRSVSGGLARWKREGLPTVRPPRAGTLDRERYARQLSLPEVGVAGQQRLCDSRVLLVGVGGLGSPSALYLAAAGVGHLTLVDDDRVERSNLQRQVLHHDADTGTLKVQSAQNALRALNPEVEVSGVELRLDSSNARQVLAGHHVVIDGSDNFETRYAVNEACIALGLPNVHGSVFRFEGQVSVFWPARPGSAGPCYQCLYPQPPPPEARAVLRGGGSARCRARRDRAVAGGRGAEAAAWRRRPAGRTDAAFRRAAGPLRRVRGAAGHGLRGLRGARVTATGCASIASRPDHQAAGGIQ